MTADVVANAFEPFFTTKGPGKGTGLGLSMVYGFARQAGGTVTIDSCVDRGTAVSIYLPRARATTETGAAPQAGPGRLQNLRILLADDDPDVREATQEMLGELGHIVVAAPDGPSALDRLVASRDFDLLIADFAMPGMNGAELATQAQAVVPGLPVLFMTGYVNSDGLRAWSERGYRTLKKPFHVTELAVALRTALGLPLDSEV
jgi:CheY-like chemotaxis protein